jgi:hypothetical protein
MVITVGLSGKHEEYFALLQLLAKLQARIK